MTNKLPVVGKRYKRIPSYEDQKEIIYKVLRVGCNTFGSTHYLVEEEGDPESAHFVLEYDFFELFEELPKDKAETKPTIKENLQVELNPEVKEAMEGLRKILIKENDSMFFTVHQSEYTTEVLRLTCHAFNDKAIKLLNALDKQFKVNETSKSVDVKEEEAKEKNTRFAKIKKLVEEGKVFFPTDPEFLKERDEKSDWFYALCYALDIANNKIQAEEVVDNKIEAEKWLDEQIDDAAFKIMGVNPKLSKCANCNKKLGIIGCGSQLLNGSFCLAKCVEEAESKAENKEESIWKPISEEVDNQSIIFINKAGYARLAEAWNDKFYFIEGDAGGANVRSHMIDKTYYGKKFCTLTDFINDYEKLKERVKELEKCLKK